jgi:hypothetical protein
MIDLTTEQAISLRGALHLPEMQKDGEPRHVATIYRWATRGIKGVVLETVQQGSARVTTREAIDRFFYRLSGDGGTELPGTRTPLRRQRDHDRAEKELAAAGY